MEADLILADYAAVDSNRKFTLVGAGFNQIAASNFPCVHQSMFLMVLLKFDKKDAGKNRINVHLVGEKGRVFWAEGMVDVKPEHNSEAIIPISFHLQNSKFEVPGEYHLEALINGEKKASQVLNVVHIPKPPQQPS